MRVHVLDLADRAVTRSRGRLAYDKLRRYLSNSAAIELDISERAPISLSFLDEVVWRLSDAGDLERVTFVADKPDALRKLARVAEIRKVDINYFDAKTGTTRVVKRLPGHKHRVGTSKAKPLRGLSPGSSSWTT